MKNDALLAYFKSLLESNGNGNQTVIIVVNQMRVPVTEPREIPIHNGKPPEQPEPQRKPFDPADLDWTGEYTNEGDNAEQLEILDRQLMDNLVDNSGKPVPVAEWGVTHKVLMRNGKYPVPSLDNFYVSIRQYMFSNASKTDCVEVAKDYWELREFESAENADLYINEYNKQYGRDSDFAKKSNTYFVVTMVDRSALTTNSG